MRISRTLIWVCQTTMVLLLCECKVLSFALESNLNHQRPTPENAILKENNTPLTTDSTVNMVKKDLNAQKDGKNKLYIGHGIYLYKSNETTSKNSTRNWKVNNVDIPQLFRLSFPAADPKDDPYTTSNKGDNNNNSNANSLTIGGIHPWILGLASFVGCLLVMVVITVVILARRWMLTTLQTTRHCRHNNDNDLDDLVVEADPDGPKFTASNLSPLPPPRISNLSLIAPGILSPWPINLDTSMFSQNIYRYPGDRLNRTSNHSMESEFPDNLLPIPYTSTISNNNFNLNREMERPVYNANLHENIQTDFDFLPNFTNSPTSDNQLKETDSFGSENDIHLQYTTSQYNNNDNLSTSRTKEQVLFEREPHHQYKNLVNIQCYSKNNKQNTTNCDEYLEHSCCSSKQTNNDLASSSQQNVTAALPMLDSSNREACRNMDDSFSNAASQLQQNCNNDDNNSNNNKPVFSSNDVCAKMTEFIPAEKQSSFSNSQIAGCSSPLSCITEISCYAYDSAQLGPHKNTYSDVNGTLNDDTESFVKAFDLHR